MFPCANTTSRSNEAATLGSLRNNKVQCQRQHQVQINHVFGKMKIIMLHMQHAFGEIF